MEPVNFLVCSLSISSGAFQWPSVEVIPSFVVGMVSSRLSEHMNVLDSTRATSPRVLQAKKLEGREREERGEGGDNKTKEEEG